MSNKIKVGIFFGGPSREREISFKGGRTAFEFIDKGIFEPIPILVDSLGNFIEIDTEYLYKDSIRDFYPSKNLNRGHRVYIESLGKLNETQLYKLIYKVGKQIKPEKLKSRIDFAFSVMHGPYGEDGSIQGLLDWLGIPYMGPGILGSSIGIDKAFQNMLLNVGTGQKKKTLTISSKEWKHADKSKLFGELISEMGFPLVIKAPHQGSSIGVAITQKRSLEEFKKCMQQCFFEQSIQKKDWTKLTKRQKKNIADKISSLNEGIGYPLTINQKLINHPADLISSIDEAFDHKEIVTLKSATAEDYVVIEEFIEGTEFSMGVIQNDEFKTLVLPPTEISSETGNFDFKSKYQTSETKKYIPVRTSTENLDKIEQQVLAGFNFTGMSVIARIDGFINSKDEIILHDPNTIPGMSPTSLIFKQMVEIGLNITESITYMIRQSLLQRRKEGRRNHETSELILRLESLISLNLENPKQKVGIVFGETAEEYETAREKYNQMAASEDYTPTCICSARNGNFYEIPINKMFKSNIEEFGKSIGQKPHEFVQKLIDKTSQIRGIYTKKRGFKVSKIEPSVMNKTFDRFYLTASKSFVDQI